MAAQKSLIGFIGQGWIGKNYADDFEKRGFTTVRYALEEPYRANKEKIKECDVVFIAVPTPTSPETGFDVSIVKEAVALVGAGKIAVIKSTILPGMTVAIQRDYPAQIVLFSPEFLVESTAAYDAAHPFANIIGTPEENERYHAAAAMVHGVLPEAPFSQTCKSEEAELFKYAHNINGYMQILTYNLIYDVAERLGAKWDVIHKSLEADPMISNWYIKPIHKSGRGAGGHCFIKDYAALREFYEKNLPTDREGIALMRANEQKNIQLLRSSGKDLDLLAGVYGTSMLTGAEEIAKIPAYIPVTNIGLLVCTQSVDEADPAFGFFTEWVKECARRTRALSLIYLQGNATSLPENVQVFSLGKDNMRGARMMKRIRYALRFVRYAWRERHAYDAVLVHINTEYVILGGLLWRLLGKKVFLIANNMESPLQARLAAFFAHAIFYTDEHAYAARFAHATRIPTGIEADVYMQTVRNAKPRSLLSLGRMARGKKLDAVIAATARAAQKSGCHLDVYGVTVLKDDEKYEQELQARFKGLEKDGLVSFCGSVPHAQTPSVYAAHDIFVHAASISGFNKSLFEAMAAGCIVITSAPELRGVVHPDLFLSKIDEESLARAIQKALSLSPAECERERATLRSYVGREHALSVIVPGMLELMYPLEYARSINAPTV